MRVLKLRPLQAASIAIAVGAASIGSASMDGIAPAQWTPVPEAQLQTLTPTATQPAPTLFSLAPLETAFARIPEPTEAPTASPRPTPRPTPRPSPKPHPYPPPPGRHYIDGVATFYVYVPLGAAAGPKLRRAIGGGDHCAPGPRCWRNRLVTVWGGGSGLHITVRLTDWCACGGDHIIDLDTRAFAYLAGPKWHAKGILAVRVRW